jgi:gliding motility-associated-like protein
VRFFVCVLLCLPWAAAAQVDTEFWFAPPEVTSGHGDRPIFLRISTLNQAAEVRVFQPARNALLASVSVAANSTTSVNLTGQINTLEPAAPAIVQANGIRITATAPVTAYYEVSAPFNADIFALKGKNALGNRFVIPGQNLYSNSSEYAPTPFFSFDIVATRNNTVVRIRPTRPLQGHGSGEFIIKLNAGETYSLRKTSLSAADNPIGTIVESNRPIAITLKDDSVIMMTCRDLLGDQLVPVEVAGSEYVVVRGFLWAGQPEFVFITAIENQTTVQVTTGAQHQALLRAGELTRVQITTPFSYIRSDKPVYVIHVTGFGCELGMAVLPSVNCRGSTQIGFTRATSEFFGLNILVRREGIGNFQLNGSTSMVRASSFQPVPGSQDVWYAAQISLTTGQVPVGIASLISNSTHSFQIGLINGNETSSCRYGYFSAFSTLFIGDDFTLCEGETAVLDAGHDKDSYLWSTGATSPTITVSQPGAYWVRTEREGCTLTDTVKVTSRRGTLNLGPDVTVCENDEAVIDGKENFSWRWSNGSTDRQLRTRQPGKYWVTVFDLVGCQAADTIQINHVPRPALSLGADITKCPETPASFNIAQPDATFLWDNGTTTPTRTIFNAGTYWAQITRNGCATRDSIRINNLPGPPQRRIEGTETVCPLVRGVVYAVRDTAGATYRWTATGGVPAATTGPAIAIDWGGANAQAGVEVQITDAAGCIKTLQLPVRINRQLAPRLPAGPDTLCFNAASRVPYAIPPTTGSVYTWFVEGGTIYSGQGMGRVLVDWRNGLGTIWIQETSVTADTVCAGNSPRLQVYVYTDPTALRLDGVSVHPEDESRIRVTWTVQRPDQIGREGFTVLRRDGAATQWITRNVPPTPGWIEDTDRKPQEQPYTYQAVFTSRCNQIRESALHTTMLLRGEAQTDTEQISINWSPYIGWPQGVARYEVWGQLDEQEDRLIATLPETDARLVLPSVSAFDHRYRIRAVERNGPGESLSNSIRFAFEHAVEAPNVFTPNGDGFNPLFIVKNIHLFPENRLVVLNRWGVKVFEQLGYQNTWDGGDLEPGTYFFSLTLARGNQQIRGTLSIVR